MIIKILRSPEPEEGGTPATPPSAAATAVKGGDFVKIKKLQTQVSQLEDENKSLKDYLEEVTGKRPNPTTPANVPASAAKKKSWLDSLDEAIFGKD